MYDKIIYLESKVNILETNFITVLNNDNLENGKLNKVKLDKMKKANYTVL